MGCYNHTGNFSSLPIKYGDRIVILVGVISKKRALTFNEYTPGDFIPISVPIRGQYNEYGGIENVDKTPGIDVLEQYFDGADVEKIVSWAERIQAGCKDDVDSSVLDNVYKKILIQTGSTLEICPDPDFELSYIMEHEEIFDHIISLGSPMLKDAKYTHIPHEFIEELGYKKELVETSNSQQVIKWTHDSLPTLMEDFYTWLEPEFKNYSYIIETLSDFSNKIGCELPEKYRNSYFLEECFKYQINICSTSKNPDKDAVFKKYKDHTVGLNINITDEEIKKHIDLLYNMNIHSSEFENEIYYMTFLPSSVSCNYVFNIEHVFDKLIACSFGNGKTRFDIKYMKDICDLGGFIIGLRKLQIPWGSTTYYSQEINYDQHINFLKKCVEVVNIKNEN